MMRDSVAVLVLVGLLFVGACYLGGLNADDVRRGLWLLAQLVQGAR